jgi:AraC-like DNA-binding protein
MDARGFSAEQVLDGSGLTQETVNDEWFAATPDHYRQIISNMLTLTNNPHLALTMAAEFKINDLGVFGYAALSSANLGQAREIFHKYHPYNDYFLSLSNYVRHNNLYNELHEVFPLNDLLPFAVEEFAVRSITLPTMLTGKSYPILELHVTYGPPEPPDLYEKVLGCPCYFNQPRNLLMLDIKRLDDKIQLADEETFRICEQQCRELIQIRNEGERMADKVKRILLRMPGQFPAMDNIASALHMSTRTLRRQLATEDISYQQIVDTTRKELALQYLQHSRLSAKEISYLLGYTHVSNFRKAFKNWTGKNISAYKESKQSE